MANGLIVKAFPITNDERKQVVADNLCVFCDRKYAVRRDFYRDLIKRNEEYDYVLPTFSTVQDYIMGNRKATFDFILLSSITLDIPLEVLLGLR